MARTTTPPHDDIPDEESTGTETDGGSSADAAAYHHPIDIDLIDPDAVKVLKRLTRAGHTAYLVGGGVRDLLLGRQPKDFDVATSAKPNQVRDLFRNCRVIGRRFRLAHVMFTGGKIIEVATFRRNPRSAELGEVDLDDDVVDAPEGARPITASVGDDTDLLIRHDNVFGEPREDAIRRDFTINGLFYDIEREEVIDYVDGMRDLQERVMRTIGRPDVRFREDPIRILRAIKFSARLDLGIDSEVYDAMVDHREELARAARPRLLEEVLRLLRGGAAHRSVYLMWDVGALSVVMPELSAFLDDDAPGSATMWGRLRAIDTLVAEGRPVTDNVLMGALLLGLIEEALDGADDWNNAYSDLMDELGERLAVPRRMKDRIRLIGLAQKRLRSSKLKRIRHTEFFADAMTLYELQCRAEGREIPEWDAPADDGAKARRPRRDPRRERRRPPPA
jgi:poly(A) polymerase